MKSLEIGQKRISRVLLVGDVARLHGEAAAALKRAGFHVEQIGTAPGALELVESAAFDAIVAEHDLRAMDGVTLLEEVAGRQPNCFRVLLTGATALNFELLEGNEVFHRFVLKPYSPYEVVEALRSKRASEITNRPDAPILSRAQR